MHGTYAEGLNYVPFLAQSSATPPLSSRSNYSHSSARRRSSTLSLPRLTSTITTTTTTTPLSVNALCYNGNYEGDASMFGILNDDGISKSHLLDTDSETEFECMHDIMMQAKRFGTTTQTTHNNNTNSSILTNNAGDSQLKRLCKYYISKYLPQQHLVRITAYAERLQQNAICRRLYDALCFFAMFLLWLTRLLVTHVMRMNNWTHQLWRGKTLLRNAARRLLWWMTLAKFKDVTYFVLILVATPPLFVVAVFGLALSLYCAVKDSIYRSGGFLRHRVF